NRELRAVVVRQPFEVLQHPLGSAKGGSHALAVVVERRVFLEQDGRQPLPRPGVGYKRRLVLSRGRADPRPSFIGERGSFIGERGSHGQDRSATTLATGLAGVVSSSAPRTRSS